jgi:DNA-directed RNA polymerase subunit RPC12/RpoP
LTGDELETKEEYICPRCGYQLTIPTRPSDSKVRRIWSLYCPRCGHSWYVKTPVEDIEYP